MRIEEGDDVERLGGVLRVGGERQLVVVGGAVVRDPPHALAGGGGGGGGEGGAAVVVVAVAGIPAELRARCQQERPEQEAGGGGEQAEGARAGAEDFGARIDQGGEERGDVPIPEGEPDDEREREDEGKPRGHEAQRQRADLQQARAPVRAAQRSEQCQRIGGGERAEREEGWF